MDLGTRLYAMNLTRPLGALQAPIASSSRPRLRDPSANRYLALHALFTRQASTIAHPPPRISFPYRPRNAIRFKSSAPHPPSQPCPNCPNVEASTVPGHAQDYVPFIRRLIHRTHHIKSDAPHRPTKEELLSATSSRWERLRIHLKWFFIRGWRRFNTDDLSAFASFFVVGNTLWILIGTTTFVSAIFATLNSLSLQKYVAKWISDYLTSETGVNVL